MEKLVYDIIPRNQRSNPKGFRLLVKLQQQPSYAFEALIALASYRYLQTSTVRPSTRAIFLLLVSCPQPRQRYGDQESEDQESEDQDHESEGCHGGGGDSG
jgi:hypothetical protein